MAVLPIGASGGAGAASAALEARGELGTVRVGGAGAPQGPAPAPGAGGDDFASRLAAALDRVAESQAAAARASEALATGHGDVHTTMIALEKADISLRLLVSVRNRLIEAYQEIMRMQV